MNYIICVYVIEVLWLVEIGGHVDMVPSFKKTGKGAQFQVN